MSVADDHLLNAALAGDEDALSLLLERYGPAIRQGLTISSKWATVLDADDVMQVTYMEAFLRIREFRPTGAAAFRAWLNRIAQNNLRDAIRGLECDKRPPPQRRIQSIPTDESYVAMLDRIAAPTRTASSIVSRREAVQALESAMKQLPPDYERVLRLCELEMRTGEEVAAEMKRTAGAVRMLLARARQRLAEILGSSSRFFGDTA